MADVARILGFPDSAHAARNETRPKRWRLPWKTRTRRASLLDKLPNEILILIFGLMDRVIVDPSIYGKRKRDDLRLLPLVCKAWYGPATSILYEVVDISRVSAVFKFHQSLVDYPHLRSMVKTLALPGRVWRTCPEPLMRTFMQIIELSESLEILYTMCQLTPVPSTQFMDRKQMVIPFTSTKHRDLRELDLYANSKARCVFPSLVAFTFDKLEWLALYGFYLEDVDPGTTPPLPNLITITCSHGDSIMHLDAWLQTCPKLTTLVLTNTHMSPPVDDIPPLGLLRQGTISYLGIDRIYPTISHDGDTSFHWLRNCDGLLILELDRHTFNRLTIPLPASVDTLILRPYHHGEEPTVPSIGAFLNSNPGVKNLEWWVCKHDRWFITNRTVLQKTLTEHGVIMLQDNIACVCRSSITSKVITPATRWTWGRIVGIVNRELAERMKWEKA